MSTPYDPLEWKRRLLEGEQEISDGEMYSMDEVARQLEITPNDPPLLFIEEDIMPLPVCKDCGEEAGSPWATVACRFEVKEP